MINYPKISIITPNYNQERYLEDAICSVIEQNYPNLEYIIIDGGSTDKSIDIIRKYEKYISYWVSEPDKGIYDAMNKGILKSTGDWIYFLGADDKLCKGILVRIFEQNVLADLIYGNVIFKQSNLIYDRYFDSDKLAEKNICHQAIFYSRKLFNKIGFFDLRYKIMADYALNLRAFGCKDCIIRFVDECIAVYNEEGTSGKTLDDVFFKDKYRLVQKNLKIKISRSVCFEKVGASGLAQIEKGLFLKGFLNIIRAMIFTQKKWFFLKNALYWLVKYYKLK